jgi:hypothetical protein
MKMLKKSLFAVAMLAVVMPAFAGSVKIHEPWPCSLLPQEVAKIDVVMDVGYYIQIVDQGPLEVFQDTTSNDPYHTYTGCKTTDVKTNFTAQLILSAAGVGGSAGNWVPTASDLIISPPGENIEICVTGTDVQIDKLTGGAKDQKVAEITVKVLPAV